MKRRAAIFFGLAVGVLLLVVGGRLALLAWIFGQIEPSPLPPISPAEGVVDVRAQTCGSCHPDQLREWAQTKMGQAMTDPFFADDFRAQGEPFVCLRCHAPLPSQQPMTVTGLASLKPLVGSGATNPTFDPALQDEGVTCVVCHLVDGELVGTIADPRGAPHPTRHDPQFGSPATCVRCHQLAPPPFSGLDRPLPDTHGEHTRWQELTGSDQGCVDCHMSRVDWPAAVGGPIRSVRRHDFAGAWNAELVRSGLQVGEARFADGAVHVTLKNLAGHSFPTAEPARALQLRVLDASGSVLGQVELARRVALPRLQERGDNALGPAEERVVSIPLSASDASDARVLSVRFLQLHFLPEGVDPALAPALQTPIEIARRPL